jgi:Zn-dependent M28 family amino/carboxypeptidase
MEQNLEDLVEELCKPGTSRKAGGANWHDTMVMMETLIEKSCRKPDIQSWKNERGEEFRNYSIVISGRSEKKIILGAHYDTYEDTPGADDNASGVAILLCLSRLLHQSEPELPFTTELVWYACEEPPFFGSKLMGSCVHANSMMPKLVKVMICLEMVGYFCDEKNSQEYPWKIMKYLYGDKGNFLLLVSNLKSFREMQGFRKSIPKERKDYRKLISPFGLGGTDWSDHRNYWEKGIPAFMITDTSFFRNKNYHTKTDKPDTLNYRKMKLLLNDLFQYIINLDQ